MDKINTVRLIPKLNIDGKKTAIGAVVVIDVVLTIILMAGVAVLTKVYNFYAGLVIGAFTISLAVWKMHVWFQIADCYNALG